MRMKPLHVAFLLLLSIAVAVLDGMMLAMLIPISYGLFEQSFAFMSDWPGIGLLFEQWPVLTQSYPSMFLLMASFTFLLAVGRGAGQYFLALSTERFFGEYSTRLAGFLFSRYLQFGKAYFDSNNAGKLAAVINYHYDFLTLCRGLLRGLTEVLTLLTYLVVMLLISWRLLLVVAVIFPIAYALKRWVAKRIRKLGEDARAGSEDIIGQFYQVLTSVPLFQAFSGEKGALRSYRKVADRLRSVQFRTSVYRSLILPVQEISSLLILLLILSMALILEGDSTRQIAAMFVFFFVARLALPRLAAFHEIELEFEEKLPCVRVMFEVFDDAGKHIVPSGSRQFTVLRGDIEFRHLSFAYPEGPDVIHGVSFKVANGRMTALVGPSGAGKSTLTHLLMRFYDVAPGQLYIDGRDIREYSIQSLRAHIALVNQDVVLLNDTLRNNLVFGMDEPVADFRLEQVLSDACLPLTTESLPTGLDTVLGDRGMTLSGGQRQRVAIARALLRRSPILILDEATSSLDSRTERDVQNAIENVVRGCTSLVIAHRLSTIQKADRVVVLDQGRVVEQGTVAELISGKGLFHELWRAQKFD